MTLRERVAEIVNPNAHKAWLSLRDYCIRQGDDELTAIDFADKTHGPDVEKARATADAIIPIILEEAAKVADRWRASDFDESSNCMAENIAADIREMAAIRKLGSDARG